MPSKSAEYSVPYDENGQPAPSYADVTNREALKKVLHVGLLGLGLGAGARGLTGLPEMLRGQEYPKSSIGPGPTIVNIDTPQITEEEKKKKSRFMKFGVGDPLRGTNVQPYHASTYKDEGVKQIPGNYPEPKGIAKRLSLPMGPDIEHPDYENWMPSNLMPKSAPGNLSDAGSIKRPGYPDISNYTKPNPSSPSSLPTGVYPSPAPSKLIPQSKTYSPESILTPTPNKPSISGDHTLTKKGDEDLAKQYPGTLNFLLGRQHRDIMDKPWVMTAGVGMGAAGLAGGYLGTDKLVQAHRRRLEQQNLDDAKDEYKKSLIEQYTSDSPSVMKKIANDLDTVYELYKDAAPTNPLEYLTSADARDKGVGALTNMYAAFAIPTAAMTGAGVYSYMKDKGAISRATRAIKTREKLRYAAQPPAIYAVGVPRDVQKKKRELEDDDTQVPAGELNTSKIAALNEAKIVASYYKP